jgi:hypothetical protein
MSHVDRMKTELAELVERLKKLDAFVEAPEPSFNGIMTIPSPKPNTFASLSVLEQQLMREQRSAMKTYAEKLAARISLA